MYTNHRKTQKRGKILAGTIVDNVEIWREAKMRAGELEEVGVGANASSQSEAAHGASVRQINFKRVFRFKMPYR